MVGVQIHRSGKAVLDVAAAVTTKLEHSHDLAQALGAAAVRKQTGKAHPALNEVYLDLDVDAGKLTSRLTLSSPASRDLSTWILEQLEPDMPHIIAMRGKLPSLLRCIQPDDVVVLNECEACALNWLGLAAGVEPADR